MRLLSVCLAALVLAACSSSEGGGDDGPTAGQIPDKAGMTVKGIVKDSAGNGIAGVVVSDGLEVTATDERGIYYLASDLARRNFVFVSVPADCEIPATQGCPRFYRKIDPANWFLQILVPQWLFSDKAAVQSLRKSYQVPHRKSYCPALCPAAYR